METKQTDQKTDSSDASSTLSQLGFMRSVWGTVTLRRKRGRAEGTTTVTAPGGWQQATSKLGRHRLWYTDNPIREFEIDWRISHAGNTCTITAVVAVQSTSSGSTVDWDADIEIGVDYFG